MFKKGPDIDKKKLLLKASDVKKDSLTRLKHFKTLIEHSELNELPVLFRTHFSFIYHTFIDTFSTFDCNSKQRRDDLECILFMLEKILIYNPELIKKRWQFYSITFVMQKLLHQNNTWHLRQEGVRLFILWYQILCDETNPELQTMFGSLVRGIVPQSSLPISSPTTTTTPSNIMGTSQHQQYQQQQHKQYSIQQQKNQTHINNNLPQANLPIKLCSIDPLVPMSPNEQLPSDETSFYLDSLLQYMVTQTTKPIWASPDEARKNQELGFSFTFNMFKKIYLNHLFPNLNLHLDSPTRSYISNHSIHQYVDEMANDSCQYLNNKHYNNGDNYNNNIATSPTSISPSGGYKVGSSTGIAKREPLHIDLKQSNHFVSSPSPMGQSSLDHERTISLSSYQAIVIKWLTRILRQDMIPGQDELIRAGGSVERQQQANNNNARETSSSQNDSEYNNYTLDPNSSTIFQGIETTSREMEVARRVIGTWPENIEVVHDLFRRAFLNYYQPASMKRVVNVYKEWICNGGPNQGNPISGRTIKLGYSSFSDLLQVFVLNSSSAFVTRVQNPQMLEEQVEMCKRIMNIYRYMVMKIYMNTSTWEQLLNVMLSITERLFPIVPPEKKENTIGGRIAPAFFQTFIVSWIRANLYVHISSQMWHEFHRVMKSLVKWRELVEEWRTTMGSLTRVLVKHVYGLSLTDLPLDRPQERRRRPKATKSFSTAESSPVNKSLNHSSNEQPTDHQQTSATNSTTKVKPTTTINSTKPSKGATSIKLHSTGLNRGRLARSNSYGSLFQDTTKLYYCSSVKSSSSDAGKNMRGGASSILRRIKSEYFLLECSSFYRASADGRSGSPTNNDVMDGSSLKDSNLIIEHDHALDSHSHSSSLAKTSCETPKGKKQQQESSKTMSPTDKCVLLGGSVRGWTAENSVIMWRRMLGLFGNINHIEDIDNHFLAIKCLESILSDFIKTRDNLGVSLDNQSTPEQPRLIPPHTYPMAWLLEATHLPRQFRESRLLAQELLCLMFIRRHDIELSPQHYGAFYEVVQRALASPDPSVHASIIKNSPQLLSLELPGSTFLVRPLYERCRSILANVQKGQPADLAPKDQAIQTLGSILTLHRPIRKLQLISPKTPELSSMGGLSAAGSSAASNDIKTRVFDTLLACNIKPVNLETQTRCKSLCLMALHVYQELCDKQTPDKDLMEVEKLFDTLMGELQECNDRSLFRMNCDLLRLYSDHAHLLANTKPALVSSILHLICQLIVSLSADDNISPASAHKEFVNFLLICLEDWCLSLGKTFMVKPLDHLVPEQGEANNEHNPPGESLITMVLKSLESVINDQQSKGDTVCKQRGSIGLLTTSSSLSSSSSSSSSSTTKHSDSNHAPSQDNKSSNIMGADNLSHHQQESSHPSTMNPNALNQNTTKHNKSQLGAIKLACKVSHHKLITYLGHFPLRQVGAASMSCCVSESDYLTASEQQELTDFKSTPGVLLLVLDGSTIITFIGASAVTKSDDHHRPMHLIIRNLCGKYSWDVTCLETTLNKFNFQQNNQNQTIVMDPETFQETQTRASMTKYDSDFNEDGNSSSSLSSRSSSSRDCIGDILQQLSSSLASATGSSIGSFQNMQRKRNSAQSVSNPRFKLAQAEETMIALLTNQRFQELNYCDKSDDMDRVVLNLGTCDGVLTGPSPPTASAGEDVAFDSSFSSSAAQQHHQQQQPPSRANISLEQCRQLVQQLGYLSWEKRCKVDSLAKSARLLRELKNLDAQSSRETHKIAVFYVAEGQEDKSSILLNTAGSRAFDEFVAGLGWEVNLASHLGFKGGLQTNKSTGDTSFYYCNGTTEVMYHVSTKIPASAGPDDESLNKKLRHLGNDEIHIIWSEHWRDYRRGIIPTEFGDVIIAIYPMLTFQGYYRVQISSKQEVPIFGPLFDNCLVHQSSLAGLVRATAINASRAKRLTLPFYRSHFEERSQLIETLVRNHTEKLSFEEFAMQLYNSGELPKSVGSVDCSTAPTTTCTAQVMS